MDYSDDVFHTFLGQDSENRFGSQRDSHKPPGFIQNILNCVPKTNKTLMGLEQHGTKFSFWGEVTL